MWWALREVVLDHCSISAVGAVLQSAWSFDETGCSDV